MYAFKPAKPYLYITECSDSWTNPVLSRRIPSSNRECRRQLSLCPGGQQDRLGRWYWRSTGPSEVIFQSTFWRHLKRPILHLGKGKIVRFISFAVLNSVLSRMGPELRICSHGLPRPFHQVPMRFRPLPHSSQMIVLNYARSNRTMNLKRMRNARDVASRREIFKLSKPNIPKPKKDRKNIPNLCLQQLCRNNKQHINVSCLLFFR